MITPYITHTRNYFSIDKIRIAISIFSNSIYADDVTCLKSCEYFNLSYAITKKLNPNIAIELLNLITFVNEMIYLMSTL